MIVNPWPNVLPEEEEGFVNYLVTRKVHVLLPLFLASIKTGSVQVGTALLPYARTGIRV